MGLWTRTRRMSTNRNRPGRCIAALTRLPDVERRRYGVAPQTLDVAGEVLRVTDEADQVGRAHVDEPRRPDEAEPVDR